VRYIFDHDFTFFDGSAEWVWSREGVTAGTPDLRPVQVRYFARKVRYAPGQQLVLALSADTRFMLYVNGCIVARGPQKGDVAHQFYDVLDLSEDMVAGENLLLVRIDSYAKAFPYPGGTGPSCSDMSAAPLFVADGLVLKVDGAVHERLSTGEEWLVRTDPALSFVHNPEMGTYVGFTEQADLTKLPSNFHAAPDLDDGTWEPCTVVHTAYTPENAEDAFLPHRLIPRFIAPLHHADAGFAAVREVREGDARPEMNASGSLAVTVPPHSSSVFILDAGRIFTAYPRLTAAGGQGARIQLKYTECLRKNGVKGDRNQVEGHDVVGYYDSVTVGNENTFWSPLHWRAFRYIEVSVETASEPLTISELRFTDCHYPLFPPVAFQCSDPQLTKFWEIGVRTQQACAHETFEDCPYYEQLQYGGDVQVQNQFTFAISGDTRMPLQAIRFFHWSRLPEGLTQSRYPSRVTQVIPHWSLHNVFSLHDWYQYTGDVKAIRLEVLDAPGILRWFLDRRDSSGLVGKLPYWCVADWSPEWMRDHNESVPGVKMGPTALTNFMVIAGLEKMAGLLTILGEGAAADAFVAEAKDLRARAEEMFWNPEAQVYMDSPHLDVASQLTNAWALLIDLPGLERAEALAERIHTRKSLCQAAYFGHFFLFEAWAARNRQDLVLANFATYRELCEKGVTTWPEDPTLGRSDCHSWSTAASYHLLRSILGFSIMEPGCTHMKVSPYLEGLRQASGSFVTPQGSVALAYEADSPQPFTLDVPKGVSVSFTHKEISEVFGPGQHTF
jgi:alpha-L-rhamnosidase